MDGLAKECIYCICLNAKSAVISSDRVAEGTVSSVPLQPRNVLEKAMRHNAHAVILAHNHPGGNPRPSIQDRQMTRNLQYVLSSAEVPLLDHLIVSDTKMFSFANQRLMEEIHFENGGDAIAQKRLPYDVGTAPDTP